MAIDRVEIRSNLFDPIVIDLRQNSEGTNPAMQALYDRVQPALIFDGRAGHFEVAPGGMPSGSPATKTAIKVGGAILAGTLLGYILLK